MEPLLLFTTAFIVGLSGALMPGPVTAVTAEHTLKRGFVAAPLVTLGHGLVEGLVVLLLALGLGGVLAARGVTGVIGFAGGGVLAWMGWGMIKSARAGTFSLDGGGGGEEKRAVGPVAAGLLATVANPYWFLWWATVGAGYVALSREHGFAGAFLFFSGHILADLAWLSLIAAALVSGKKFISDRLYGGIMAVLGGFLILLALYFFWHGLTLLLPGSQ